MKIIIALSLCFLSLFAHAEVSPKWKMYFQYDTGDTVYIHEDSLQNHMLMVFKDIVVMTVMVNNSTKNTSRFDTYWVNRHSCQYMPAMGSVWVKANTTAFEFDPKGFVSYRWVIDSHTFGERIGTDLCWYLSKDKVL